jgi:methionine synthase I (cobalamin-dependent)
MKRRTAVAAPIEQRTGGLLAQLDQGPVVCAEGYVFELERRGYLQAGAFVPEVVLDHPEALAQLHRDFVHAGSDVVEALTYYAHREKLRIIDKEHLLEQLNREALRIASEIARETGTLLAGDICNTNVYLGNADTAAQARVMFEEQVGWAAEADADFIIAETFSYGGEALLALEVIKAAGLPAVVTMAMPQDPVTREGWSAAEVCKRLEDAGADVVGLNCFRGPHTMLPLLREIRQAATGHIAALPVPYRTHQEQPTFQSLRDHSGAPVPGGMPFPTALDPFLCNRYEMGEFAREAYDLGVRYLGICCGAGPHHIRSMAEALGKHPAASRYTADMSRHAYFGTNPLLKRENQEFSRQL